MNVYFRIPNSSGYGPEFDTFEAAAAEVAKGWHSEYVQQVIDIRVTDTSGDYPVHRVLMQNPLVLRDAV